MRNLAFAAIALLFTAGIWGMWPAFADQKPADTKSMAGENEILPYLEQVIAWQRETVALEPTLGSARESLLKSSLVKASGNVLKYSFAFARTEAQQIDKTTTDASAGDQDGDKTRLQAASVKLANRTADLQTQISTLTDQIKKTPLTAQQPLQQQIDELNGQLKLAQAQQDLVNNLLGVFNSMVSSVNTGLGGKINSLSDTVAQTDKASDAAAAKADTASDADAKPSGGLLEVSGNLFKLWRQIGELHGLESNANAIRKTNKQFLDGLRGEIKTAITQGAEIGGTATPPPAAATPPDQTAPTTTTPPPSLEALLGNFKQLSATIVPVTQTNVSLDASIHTLDEWQETVQSEIATLLRRLAIRLAVLGGLILIPVIISDLVRRATERYVKDDKRAKQLRTIRRSLLSLAIFIIVVLNLVTEVGSFATFAGFIVGGLAVAFQNVLLSLVAFFFFYGRYSVRAGDRVSVLTVIGDVVHVGALRFYIRELEDKDGKLTSTGRIAAFPNSILFQPSAFFKYM